MIQDPVLQRLFGVVLYAVGVAYWLAYRDPIKNLAIHKFGIVDNGLATMTIIVRALTGGLLGGFFWMPAALTAFFFLRRFGSYHGNNRNNRS